MFNVRQQILVVVIVKNWQYLAHSHQFTSGISLVELAFKVITMIFSRAVGTRPMALFVCLESGLIKCKLLSLFSSRRYSSWHGLLHKKNWGFTKLVFLIVVGIVLSFYSINVWCQNEIVKIVLIGFQLLEMGMSPYYNVGYPTNLFHQLVPLRNQK